MIAYGAVKVGDNLRINNDFRSSALNAGDTRAVFKTCSGHLAISTTGGDWLLDWTLENGNYRGLEFA